MVNRTGTTVVNGEDQTTKTSENGNDHEQTTNQETPLISLNDDRHIENTVIFLPNVWTLMPTSVEYEKIAAAYKDFIDNPPLISTSKPNGMATANVAAKTTVENNSDLNNKPVNPNPNPKPATPKPAANSSKPEETTTSEKSENVAAEPSEVEEKVKTAAAEDNDSKSLKAPLFFIILLISTYILLSVRVFIITYEYICYNKFESVLMAAKRLYHCYLSMCIYYDLGRERDEW